MMGRQRVRKQRYVRSGRRVRHADDLDAMRPQQRPEVEIARIVQKHRVAGLQQETADEVDRLRA